MTLKYLKGTPTGRLTTWEPALWTFSRGGETIRTEGKVRRLCVVCGKQPYTHYLVGRGFCWECACKHIDDLSDAALKVFILKPQGSTTQITLYAKDILKQRTRRGT